MQSFKPVARFCNNIEFGIFEQEFSKNFSYEDRVIYDDNVLAGRLSIEDISTIDVDGRTRGVVRLLSKYTGDQSIQYRFYWYDDQGLEVNTKRGPWRQLIIHGAEEVSISEVSINPNGREFRVQIRQLKD